MNYIQEKNYTPLSDASLRKGVDWSNKSGMNLRLNSIISRDPGLTAMEESGLLKSCAGRVWRVSQELSTVGASVRILQDTLGLRLRFQVLSEKVPSPPIAECEPYNAHWIMVAHTRDTEIRAFTRE